MFLTKLLAIVCNDDGSKAERKGLVRALHASARALKVTLVREDASRKKVEGMTVFIRKATGPAKQMKNAEKIDNHMQSMHKLSQDC